MTCEQLSLLPQSKSEIIQGDCLEVMKKMESNSIDFIVTDPPYGLKFMNKSWDHGIPGIEFWKEMHRISKPGSMLAAFGGTRTQHRLTCAIEDAGLDIRDCIMWLYASGFPKSHNKFGLEGYGTALKPAYEIIILAMKPLDGTFAQNVEKWGIGGINIDESRICTEDHTGRPRGPQVNCYGKYEQITTESHPQGRWPANFILDEEAAEMLDEQTGILKSGSGNRRPNGGGEFFLGIKHKEANFDSSSGGASRFFYCAKASTKERNKGLEDLPLKESVYSANAKNGEGLRVSDSKIPKQNNHPTVKPISLMKYIIKLLAPPGNPTLLDPFCGSGSTLLAAKELGINAIGIEKEAEYCEIAKARTA